MRAPNGARARVFLATTHVGRATSYTYLRRD